MNKEAFKQRMQNLKSYREQNPGKGYLDWKASLPDNLQDDSSYNLKRAYELGYEPEYIEEDRSYHLPTRDSETGEILKKPWHPTFLIGLQEDAKLGYYPQTVDGTTYTTTWEGNENPIYKYANGGEIGDEEKQYLKNWYSQRRQYANSKAKYMNKQLGVIQKGFVTPDFAKTNLQHHIPYKGLDQIPITIDDNKVKSIDNNAKGYYHPNEGIVLTRDYRDPNRENLLHEMTHRLNKYGAATNKQIESIIKDQKVYDKGNYTDYLTRPEEIYSRLMEFRKLNNLDPLKVYGKPDIQKLRRTGKDADILNLFVDDDVILDLLNTTASVSNKNIIKAENGGEVPPTNKPTIVEPIPYKGKLYSDRYGKKYTEEQVYDYYNNGTDEIDRFTGGPLVRGLKPLLDLEDAANFTPVGDAVAAYDVYDAVSNKDWSGAGLAALGLVPFVPNIGEAVFKSSKKLSKSKNYIPKVNPNYKQSVIDRALREESTFNKIPNNVTEEIIDQRNRTYELMQEPYARNRAKEVDAQYGTDYLKVYDSMLDKYVNIDEYFKLPDPQYKKMERPTIAAQVTPAKGNTMYFNRDMIKAPEDIPSNVVLHEMGHLVDGAAGMNNEFLKKLGDKSKFIPFNQAKLMYPTMTKEGYNNILQGTEIKSYMNQFRNYLNQNGKLHNGNYTGSYKGLKKEIIEAPKESFNNIKAIFNLYRSPKLFNKDFQMIPIVNNKDNRDIS